MRVRTLCAWLIVFSVAAGMDPGRRAEAATPEELLETINGLPEADRHARLVEGARKEGSVVWYVAMNRENANDLIQAFQADYPFIKVNALTGRGASLLNRVITEYRAKQYRYDVFNTRGTTLNTLKKAGAIMRYRTPLRKFLRAGFYDEEGFFNGVFATPLVFLLNTKLVQPKEAPESIEDLFRPQWKGKLAIDSESFDWLAAAIDYYGEEKGKEIARRLGNQNVEVRSGPTLIAQLVAAGEFPIEIDAYQHEASALKKAGAPVHYLFPKPYIPVKSLVPLFMSSRAPNPHAAALLADFLLSKKGQAIMQNHGRWVSRKDMDTQGPDAVGDRKTVIPSPQKWGDRYQELVGLYNQLILKK